MTFVTKKITSYVAMYQKGKVSKPLLLGNLSAVRDWGYAPDYVEIMLESVEDPTDEVYC